MQQTNQAITQTLTVTDIPVDHIYSNIVGVTNSLHGSGEAFTVSKVNGVYSVNLYTSTDPNSVAQSGSGFVVGDTVIFSGTDLGGTHDNDLIVTITGVTDSGSISKFTTTGTGRIGDGIPDIIFDVTGTSKTDTYTINDKFTHFDINVKESDINIVSTVATNLQGNFHGVERFNFSDTSVSYNASGSDGDVYALGKAAFGKDFTPELMGIGLKLLDDGMSIDELSSLVVKSDIFHKEIGGTSNESFVKAVYENVLGKPLTLAQVQQYTEGLNSNKVTQSEVLYDVSHNDLFRTSIDLVGLDTTGIHFTPYVA